MQPADVYLGLRTRLLETDPHQVGIEPGAEMPTVWGVLMEFGASGSLVTLVSLADGTTSLYFSTGGGILGGGGHPEVAAASIRLVTLAEGFYDKMMPTTEFPLLVQGRIQFYVLTYSGAYMTDVDAEELTHGNHEFSPLFLAANDVITQVRLVTPENRR
jgi:hypothetical protein